MGLKFLAIIVFKEFFEFCEVLGRVIHEVREQLDEVVNRHRLKCLGCLIHIPDHNSTRQVMRISGEGWKIEIEPKRGNNA